MDFARPHRREEGVTSRSNIRILPTTSTPDNNNREGRAAAAADSNNNDSSSAHKPRSLDDLVVVAANKAAIDLFVGSSSSSSSANEELADCKLYPEHVLPTSATIQPNSLVVIFESFDNLNFVYATPKAIFSNRNGHFHHNDFINKPFGCKIRSRNNRGLGFVQLLRPTPELWARSLNHRTQIVHELDASMICFYLELRPNMVVCESGTGSGAMSHCILRTIAPKGILHTFEFNANRVERAREEFAKNKVDHLVTVHHRDVCGKSSNSSSTGEDSVCAKGGFGLGPQAAHAIFLDLPEPWLAVPHAAHTLKMNGKLASYSPCVEQSQRTIAEMQRCGFHSIKTIEVRLREHFVDEVEWELPPTAKLRIEVNPDGPASSTSTVRVLDDPANAGKRGIERSKSMMSEDSGGDDGDDTRTEADNAVTDEAETEVTEATDALTTDAAQSGAIDGATTTVATHCGKRKRTMLCARPFGNMRGHTAFLTFATAGNKVQPDPNDASAS